MLMQGDRSRGAIEREHVATGRRIRCLNVWVCSVVMGSSVQFHQDGRDQSVDDNFAAMNNYQAGKKAAQDHLTNIKSVSNLYNCFKNSSLW